MTLPSERPLAEAKARLEEYRLRYTPSHPDVRALERTIHELEERVKQEALVPHPVDERPTKEQLAFDRICARPSASDGRYRWPIEGRRGRGHSNEVRARHATR